MEALGACTCTLLEYVTIQTDSAMPRSLSQTFSEMYPCCPRHVRLTQNLPLIIVTFSVTPILGRSCKLNEFQCIHLDDGCIPNPLNNQLFFCHEALVSATFGLICKPDEFQCTHPDDGCIPFEDSCNGWIDCMRDGSDESEDECGTSMIWTRHNPEGLID